MATDKLQKVEISLDGGTTWTNISTYVRGWVYNGELNNQSDTAQVRLIKTIKDTYNLAEWMPIKIYEGWETTTDRQPFKGVITRIQQDYAFINLDCADEIYKLLKDKQVAVYNKDTDPQAGVLSAIAEDLIDNSDLNGIVENSGTTITLNQFKCSNKTNTLERINALAKALDWILLYDPEADAVYFVSRGYFINTNILDLDVDITTRAKWDEDATRLFNDLTLIGKTASAEDRELFSGDGITATFTLSKTPSDTVVVTVDSVLQVRGTPGVSIEGNYDYYINEPNKTITFVTASIPLATAPDNVVIDFSSQIPPSVHLVNDESIALYYKGYDSDGNKVGIKETIILEDITNNADAEVRARNLLEVYAYPFLSTTVTLRPDVDKQRNYKLGELIYVNHTEKGFVNKSFIITAIKREYPGGGATLTLGDKAYRMGQLENNILERLNSLEAQLSGDYDILADFKYASASMDLIAKTMKTTTNSVAGDYLIWDHAIYGIWDTQKWAPDTTADTGGRIYGHSIYGIYGVSKYGVGTSNEVIIDNEDYE